MTAPRHVDCHCGHNKMSHEVEAKPACVHDECDCTTYRPRTGPAAPPGTGSDALIAAGRRSDVRGITALAEKIDKQLAELRDRLNEDREAAAIRAEVRRLEQQLAAAKARLRKPQAAVTSPVRSPGTRATSYGDYPCRDDGCEHVATTAQGRAAHERHKHPKVDQ